MTKVEDVEKLINDVQIDIETDDDGMLTITTRLGIDFKNFFIDDLWFLINHMNQTHLDKVREYDDAVYEDSLIVRFDNKYCDEWEVLTLVMMFQTSIDQDVLNEDHYA